MDVAKFITKNAFTIQALRQFLLHRALLLRETTSKYYLCQSAHGGDAIEVHLSSSLHFFDIALVLWRLLPLLDLSYLIEDWE